MSDRNWPDRYSDPNGYLKLDDEVAGAIVIRPVDDADGPWDPEHQHEHLAIHEPTGINEEYTVTEQARGMNPNDLADAARRQLVRDNPQILAFHAPELRRRMESMGK